MKDSPLDLDYGEIIDHRRTLDLRAGVLRRVDRVALAGWPHGAGHQHPAGVADPPVDRRDRVPGRVHRRPGRPLRGPAVRPAGQRGDAAPRAATRGPRPRWTGRCSRSSPSAADGGRCSCTGPSAASCGWPRAWTTSSRCPTAAPRTSRPTATSPGTRWPPASRPADRCSWSSTWPTAGPPAGPAPALRDQVEAALATAKLAGWDRLVREQRELLDQHWDEADVEIEGDDELQQAVRVGMFHVLQAGPARRAAADPGQGADRPRLRRAHLLGHRDLRAAGADLHGAARRPRRAALAALDLDLARERARVLGRRGAAFPWRTIRGEETSGYWPAGTAAFHINADIADAVVRYYNATLDDDFDRDFGAELLIETARLWASLGHFDPEHGFRIDGVTGPDEYTAVVDNNVYTNLMAQRNLREAAEAVQRQPDVAGRLEVDRRRGRGVAAGRRAHGRALRHPARRAHAVRRLHPPRGVGLRGHAGGATTRCCCTTRTSRSTASRWSSRPTW